jgi:signal transduction histidine kinase
MVDSVFESGEPTWSEDLLLILDRKLPREEGYFTFSYGPIRDEGGSVGGIFCTCYETTGRVVGERRLKTLRDLGRTELRTSVEAACEAAAGTLAENQADIPFALIYLVEGPSARLTTARGLRMDDAAAPVRIALNSLSDTERTRPFRSVFEKGSAELVTNATEIFGDLPGGVWPEPSREALVIPIPAAGHTACAGFLISGLSPCRPLDADYRTFLELVAGHIGTSIANVRAYDAERKRAEALAEIDQTKTQFFSNVSHEFRTPLTLMLGPLEDALGSPDLPADTRQQLDIVRRNSLRVLKLVNSLLDFSRIEAGRMHAVYEPTDLATFTTELTSVFRSAVEKAALRLTVDCPTLPRPALVDRGMWEEIVLNLLSNAFKFTYTGEIVVRLRNTETHVELTVVDTGIGIAENDLPKLFERFHRVTGAPGRTHEGSGIGLALVQDLVRLHGGSVSVESVYGQGSTFRLRRSDRSVRPTSCGGRRTSPHLAQRRPSW